MKYVDITEPVNASHWRYPNFVRTLQFIKRDSPIKSTYLALERGFTHIVAPSAMIPDGKTLDDYDLYPTLNGPAAILHLDEAVLRRKEITAADLKAAYEKCENAKRLIITSGLGRIHDFYSREYWNDSPRLTEEAAQYLLSLEPEVIAFDFPEDAGMILDGEDRNDPLQNPVHKLLLDAGVLIIDHVNYAWKIPVTNAQLYAMPLRIASGRYDHGQIRTVISY